MMKKFNLSAWAVREKSLTLYLMLVTMALGVAAFLSNGRAEDPRFSVNVMVVSAYWPGATVRQMEKQVADPLAKRLEEIDWFDRVETRVQPGAVHMLISFADDTPHGISEELFYQVRKRLGDEAGKLPPGVIGPVFQDDFKDVYFTLYALASEDERLAQSVLADEAERMRMALRRVEGVKKVTLIGERPRRIFIDVDAAQLAGLGISLQALRRQIAAHIGVMDAGVLETSGPRLWVRTTDAQSDPVEAIRHLPVRIGSKVMPLHQLARVARGYETPPTVLIHDRGREAVLLGVVMESNYDGLELEKHLQAFERDYRRQLPAGLILDQITNQADAIHLALDTFQHKFFAAVAVVMLVSFVALGWRAGIVVSLAVPLTLAMAFLFMMLTGEDFNRISLGALIIALGLLVDDAIISIEMILLKMEQGVEKIEAASYAWTLTAAPMLVGTLVTVVGFLPIGIAPSRVGEYAGGLFWVTGIALLASWLVAVWFTPWLGVRILPDRLPPRHGPVERSRWYGWLRRAIAWCVRHRWFVIGTTVALLSVSAIVMKTVVVKQFFPDSDRPELLIDIRLPAGSGIEATKRVVERIERQLLADTENVHSLSAYIGQGAPRFFLALSPELPNPAYGNIVVVAHDWRARDRLRKKLQAQVDAGLFPEARVRVHPLLFGPPVPWPVVFRLYGPDTDRTIHFANRIRQRMLEFSELVDPHLSWENQSPTLRMEWDLQRLAVLGLTPADVAAQLRGMLQGAAAGVTLDGERSAQVQLRAGEADRTPERLESLPIALPDGRHVPLAQLGTVQVAQEYPYVERRNRERVVSVYAEVRPGVQPPDITMKVWREIQDIVSELPPGYRIEIGGSVEESAMAEASIQRNMPLMLLALTFLIMIYVRRFGDMFMVLLTAPLGLIGAVAALMLFHQPYGFVANLGVIALGGILMRNTLILVAQIRDNLRAGRPPAEAVIDATALRARPVLLTAAAAVLAFVPLTASVFWGPMAYVLIGGVAVGTIITLFFLPALYAAWHRVKIG